MVEFTKGKAIMQADEDKERHTLNITHTNVPRELEGQGIASKLMKEAIGYAKSHHYEIILTCSFARVYLSRHPEIESNYKLKE